MALGGRQLVAYRRRAGQPFRGAHTRSTRAMARSHKCTESLHRFQYRCHVTGGPFAPATAASFARVSHRSYEYFLEISSPLEAGSDRIPPADQSELVGRPNFGTC
jgi:hypothetical protein